VSFDHAKADAGDIACAMDGVGRAQRLLIEPFGPAVRIIVKPYRSAAPAHVDMVGQREVAKAEIAGDIRKCAGKRPRVCNSRTSLTNASTRLNIPRRGFAATSREGVPSHSIPADVLSTECHAFASQAKVGAQGPSEVTMPTLASPFKYIHVFVTYSSRI
jgi:hypothetical protein